MSEINRTEATLVTIPTGQMLTGANIQVGTLQGVANVAKVELRQIIDKALREQAAKIKLLNADLAAARAEYDKAVAAIVMPQDMSDKLKALEEALKFFHPQAARVTVPVPDTSGNATPNTKYRLDVRVDGAAKAYHGTAFIHLDAHHELDFDRTYPLPQAVINALDKVGSIQSNIGAADARLRELRDERNNIAERAEVLEASLVRHQLSEIPGGQSALDALERAKESMRADMGLSALPPRTA